MPSVQSYRVEFTTVAQHDLQAIIKFIAVDNPIAAAQTLAQLEARVRSLTRFPKRGRVVPELAAFGLPMYRELVAAPWRVVYRVSGKSVWILAVLDGRRNIEDILLDRLTR